MCKLQRIRPWEKLDHVGSHLFSVYLSANSDVPYASETACPISRQQIGINHVTLQV